MNHVHTGPYTAWVLKYTFGDAWYFQKKKTLCEKQVVTKAVR